MLRKTTILLLVESTVSINAANLAAFVPRDLDLDLNARTVNIGGGWSLSQTSAATCPATAPQCGAAWCCPGTLSCIHTGSEDIGEVCCPTGMSSLDHPYHALQATGYTESKTSLDADCSPTFVTNPVCADSSWTLWNATSDSSDGAGYFCCLQGQVGLQSGLCVEKADAVTAGPSAVEVRHSSPYLNSPTLHGI